MRPGKTLEEGARSTKYNEKFSFCFNEKKEGKRGGHKTRKREEFRMRPKYEEIAEPAAVLGNLKFKKWKYKRGTCNLAKGKGGGDEKKGLNTSRAGGEKRRSSVRGS